MRFNAEGWRLEDPCPNCGNTRTITYEFDEGFSELECEACGYHSDQDALSDLSRFQGTLREKDKTTLPPIPVKKLEA